jgi:hypothetical protein
MNCLEFESVIMDLAGNRPLAAARQEDALAHLNQCPPCARRFADEKALFAGLRALAAAQPGAPTRLEDALLTAFCSQQQSTAQTAGLKTSREAYFPALRRWGIGIAAAIPMLAALLFWQMKRPAPIGGTQQQLASAQKPVVQPRATIRQSEPAPAQVVKQANVKDSQKLKLTPRPTARQKTPYTANALVTTAREQPEIMTNYFLVTPEEELNSQEMQQIVRVKMPRATMVRFGLPVNMDRIQGTITADLVLNQEGTVRAIRFVK